MKLRISAGDKRKKIKITKKISPKELSSSTKLGLRQLTQSRNLDKLIPSSDVEFRFLQNRFKCRIDDEMNSEGVEDQVEEAAYIRAEMRACFLRLLEIVPLDEPSNTESSTATKDIASPPSSSICETTTLKKVSKLQLLQGAIDYILDLESTLQNRSTTTSDADNIHPQDHGEESFVQHASLFLTSPCYHGNATVPECLEVYGLPPSR